MPASPAFFSLHSKKHPSEIAQVIFRQFLIIDPVSGGGAAERDQEEEGIMKRIRSLFHTIYSILTFEFDPDDYHSFCESLPEDFDTEPYLLKWII